MPGKRSSQHSTPAPEIQDDPEDVRVDEEDWEEEEWERKIRSDAGQPRIGGRDISVFRWMGEQGAASADDLRELLGREAGAPTKQQGLLSKTRVRHIIEERWEPAKMVYADTMLGKKWVWPTKRALQRAGLPFAPHRPADINLNHIQQCNRIRLYLERIYWTQGLVGSWESERMIERSKKEWKAKNKADSGVYIPNRYQPWHMPDAIWTFRNTKDQANDGHVFIEVEVSQKRPEKLNDIIYNLAVHGTTWYFVDMDPKKGIFDGIMAALNTLKGRNEQLKSRFLLYDLAEPAKQVYRYEKPKSEAQSEEATR